MKSFLAVVREVVQPTYIKNRLRNPLARWIVAFVLFLGAFAAGLWIGWHKEWTTATFATAFRKNATVAFSPPASSALDTGKQSNSLDASSVRTTAEGVPAGSTLGKPVTPAPTIAPAPKVKQETSVKRHATPATRPEAAKLRVAGGLTPLSSAIAEAVIAFPPVYPYQVKQHHITGDGVCVITVDTASGKVTSATMAQSTGNALLDKSTTETLRQWRFKPRTVSRVRVPVTYTE
jgi:TonB family protein